MIASYYRSQFNRQAATQVPHHVTHLIYFINKQYTNGATTKSLIPVY